MLNVTSRTIIFISYVCIKNNNPISPLPLPQENYIKLYTWIGEYQKHTMWFHVISLTPNTATPPSSIHAWNISWVIFFKILCIVYEYSMGEEKKSHTHTHTKKAKAKKKKNIER